jgi:CelD/BcsL family acetyltransferase involved in cellulose biosynthesis
MTEVGLSLASTRVLARPASVHAAVPVPVALVPAAEAEALAGEWTVLAGEALQQNPLFLPGFVLPAARALAPGVRIATVRDAAGQLIALAPVTATRLGRIAPALRVWSHDYGPLGGPLLAGSVAGDAASGLIEAARGTALAVPDLALDGPVAGALLRAAAAAGRKVTIRGKHERAAFRADRGTDPRAMLSPRRRKEYGRQLRRLAEEGRVQQESITDPPAVVAAFDEFLALEAAGWKGARGTAMAARAETSGFAREAIARLAAAGSVRIEALRFEDRMIAGLVSILSGRAAVTWKIAYDEAFARFSPGAQVMLDAPVALAKANVTHVDSLATADHPLANHIWPDRIAIGTLIIGPARGAFRHRLALASLAAEDRARTLAKRLRDRVRSSLAKRKQSVDGRPCAGHPTDFLPWSILAPAAPCGSPSPSSSSGFRRRR